MPTSTFRDVLIAASRYDYDDLHGTRWPADILARMCRVAPDAAACDLTTFDALLTPRGGRLVLTKAELTGPRLAPLADPDAPWTSHAPYGVLVLLWGYASQGYGEYRVTQILRHNGLRKIGVTGQRAARELKRGDLGAAYEAFRAGRSNTLKWVGESFFTKLLFFLARAQTGSPAAYIKDVHTTRGVVHPGGGDAVNEVGRASYLRFVEEIESLAVEHELPGERVEELLFQASRDNLLA